MSLVELLVAVAIGSIIIGFCSIEMTNVYHAMSEEQAVQMAGSLSDDVLHSIRKTFNLRVATPTFISGDLKIKRTVGSGAALGIETITFSNKCRALPAAFSGVDFSAVGSTCAVNCAAGQAPYIQMLQGSTLVKQFPPTGAGKGGGEAQTLAVCAATVGGHLNLTVDAGLVGAGGRPRIVHRALSLNYSGLEGSSVQKLP